MEEFGGLVASSWGKDRIDLFWVGQDRALMHRWWDGSVWSADESLGGTLASGPAVTSWAVGEMEVFAIFPDGQLWDRYWDGAAWHPWETLGGELTGPPAASSWGADRLDVWAPGRDGRLWHRWWNGSEWVPWEQLPAQVQPAAPSSPRSSRLKDARSPTLARLASRPGLTSVVLTRLTAGDATLS